MQSRIQLVAILAALALFFTVLEMVRRRRLMERYALLWLLSALVLLGLAVWSDMLTKISHAIGIVYPPNALFLIAFCFVLLLLLHFSAAVSRLADQTKVLAQRLALLEERLRWHEEGTDDGPGDVGAGPDTEADDADVEAGPHPRPDRQRREFARIRRD
jgi:hypothetical protein